MSLNKYYNDYIRLLESSSVTMSKPLRISSDETYEKYLKSLQDWVYKRRLLGQPDLLISPENKPGSTPPSEELLVRIGTINMDQAVTIPKELRGITLRLKAIDKAIIQDINSLNLDRSEISLLLIFCNQNQLEMNNEGYTKIEQLSIEILNEMLEKIEEIEEGKLIEKQQKQEKFKNTLKNIGKALYLYDDKEERKKIPNLMSQLDMLWYEHGAYEISGLILNHNKLLDNKYNISRDNLDNIIEQIDYCLDTINQGEETEEEELRTFNILKTNIKELVKILEILSSTKTQRRPHETTQPTQHRNNFRRVKYNVPNKDNRYRWHKNQHQKKQFICTACKRCNKPII